MAVLKTKVLRPEFVEFFPDSLAEGILYISKEHSTAGHRCCCGCGEEVITPLNPAQWQMKKSAAGVSFYPSVGNWKFSCRSHYWIRNNRVVDAGPLSNAAIENVKRRDRLDKDAYIRQVNATVPRPSLIERVLKWFGGN